MLKNLTPLSPRNLILTLFCILGLGSGNTLLARSLPSGLGTPLEWPASAQAKSVRMKKVQENPRKGLYIYESENFTFSMPGLLSKDAEQQIATIFESTLAAIKAMPLEMERKIPRNLEVQVFRSKNAYVSAGGYLYGPGKFLFDKEVLILPPETIGIEKKSETWVPIKKFDPSRLIKEATELVISKQELPHWLSEGIGRYVGSIPYNNGTFQFSKIDAKANILSVKNRIERGFLMRTKDVEKSKALELGPAVSPSGPLSLTGYVWVNFLLNLSDEESAMRLRKFLTRSAGSWKRLKSYSLIGEHSSGEDLDERLKAKLNELNVEVNYYNP